MLQNVFHRKLKILPLFQHFTITKLPSGRWSGLRKTNRTQISLITSRIKFFEDASTNSCFCCFISLTIALGRSPPAFLESRKYLMNAVLQKPVSPKLCNQVQDGTTTTNTTVNSSTHCTWSALPPGKKEQFLHSRSFKFLTLLLKPRGGKYRYYLSTHYLLIGFLPCFIWSI